MSNGSYITALEIANKRIGIIECQVVFQAVKSVCVCASGELVQKMPQLRTHGTSAKTEPVSLLLLR